MTLSRSLGLVFSCLDSSARVLTGLLASRFIPCQAFSHTDIRMILPNCKSEHGTSLLEFLQRFPTDFRIKPQLFSMVCKVLYDLTLLASSASSLPTLTQTLLLVHSELLTTPRCTGSCIAQCLCTCYLLCMECPSPSPPQLVHSTNFSLFFYTQLSF